MIFNNLKRWNKVIKNILKLTEPFHQSETIRIPLKLSQVLPTTTLSIKKSYHHHNERTATRLYQTKRQLVRNLTLMMMLGSQLGSDMLPSR